MPGGADTTSDDLLEKWLAAGQELIKARRGSQRETELEERIAGLEARLEERPAAEVAEAFGDLTDQERELVQATLEQHRAGGPPPPADADPDPDAEETPEPPAAKRTRPGRKRGGGYTFDENGEDVGHMYVYDGDDEPDLVELDDLEPDAEADAA